MYANICHLAAQRDPVGVEHVTHERVQRTRAQERHPGFGEPRPPVELLVLRRNSAQVRVDSQAEQLRSRGRH